MPQDLPDDIWLEITENHLLDDSNGLSLRELSLTSRRIRQLALRTMYQTLVFSAPFSNEEMSSNIMPSLIRAHVRARSLCCSPELLRHVRTFDLQFWDTEDLYEILTN